MASSSTNRFSTDCGVLYVEVELDHLFLGDEFLGTGCEMSDVVTITRLRDELTELLERVDAQPSLHD